MFFLESSVIVNILWSGFRLSSLHSSLSSHLTSPMNRVWQLIMQCSLIQLYLPWGHSWGSSTPLACSFSDTSFGSSHFSITIFWPHCLSSFSLWFSSSSSGFRYYLNPLDLQMYISSLNLSSEFLIYEPNCLLKFQLTGLVDFSNLSCSKITSTFFPAAFNYVLPVDLHISVHEDFILLIVHAKCSGIC